ncbi:hypothetical protein KSP39_PZI019130 [Platanthera zijinensis]|uniref:Uncharacterized protein n=1 Tax=Platanthera zijinensis TaxID=2320716 RepID=A0AAP0B1M4_9ASPA
MGRNLSGYCIRQRTRFGPCGFPSSNRPTRLPLLAAFPQRSALLLAPGSRLFFPPFLSVDSPFLTAAFSPFSLSLPPVDPPLSAFYSLSSPPVGPTSRCQLCLPLTARAPSRPVPPLLAARVVLLATSSLGVPCRAVSFLARPSSPCRSSTPTRGLLLRLILPLAVSLSCRSSSYSRSLFLPLEFPTRGLLPSASSRCFPLLVTRSLYLTAEPSPFFRAVFSSRSCLAAGVLTVPVQIVLALSPHLVAASCRSLPWACRRDYPLRPLI